MQPWTRRQIGLVLLSAVVGLAVATLAFGVAVFSLPEEGFFSEEQDTGTRLWGVAGAVVTALAAPAGLWATARVRRSGGAALAGAAVAVAVLVAAIWYAENG